MVKITHIDYGPNDAFYSEGLKSYSPHWARKFQQPDLITPKEVDGPPRANKGTVKAAPLRKAKD